MYVPRGLGASTDPIASLIQSLAPSYGVPPSLALAVATKESGLNQAAVGSSGEIGVFQLLPSSHLATDPTDLNQNVNGGLAYLSKLYNQFGNWTDALEAYNGGPSHVSAGNVSPAAQDYAQSVLGAAGSLDTVAASADAGTIDYSGDSSVVAESGLSTGVVIAVALAAVGIALWATA